MSLDICCFLNCFVIFYFFKLSKCLTLPFFLGIGLRVGHKLFGLFGWTLPCSVPMLPTVFLYFANLCFANYYISCYVSLVSGGHLSAELSPYVKTFTSEELLQYSFQSPMDVVDFLAQQEPVEGSYAGVLTAHLHFLQHGFQSYQLLLAGEKEQWLIPMHAFSGLPLYVEDLDQASMVIQFDPALFMFNNNSPVSSWVRLTDLTLQLPDNLPHGFSLDTILVRTRLQRMAQNVFHLILESIVEHDEFKLETANKSQWAKTSKAAAVVLFSQQITVLSSDAAMLEIMPTVSGSQQGLLKSITDSAVRFGVLKVLLDVSTASSSNNFLEWIAHAKKPKRSWPNSTFSDKVVFPITQFLPADGSDTTKVQINGAFYQVTVGRPYVAQLLDAPPSYADAMAQSVAPSVSWRSAAPPYAPSAPPAPTSVAQPLASTSQGQYNLDSAGESFSSSQQSNPSQGSQPLPPTLHQQAPQTAPSTQQQSSTQSHADHFSGNNRIISRAFKLPAPTKRLKFSPNVVMAQHFLPGLPPLVQQNLAAAWASSSQTRFLAVRKQILKILGRDPYLYPEPFDSIFIVEAFMARKLKPSTVKQYMSIHQMWCQSNGIRQRYKGIVSLAIRGYSNRAYTPLYSASRGFSLPFNFSSLRLVAEGLRLASISPALAASTWATCLLLFWGLLRGGEVLSQSVAEFDISAQLCPADVIFNEDKTMRIWIKSPKVQSYHGDIIEYIPLDSMPGFCPVRAVVNYLHIRNTISMDKDLPLFLLESGFPLTADKFAKTWKSALAHSKLPAELIQQHSTHGFRASLPSLLQLANLPDDQIKVLGRWSSHTAYLRYLKNTAARATAKKQALEFCQQLVSALSDQVSCKVSLPLFIYHISYLFNIFRRIASL